MKDSRKLTVGIICHNEAHRLEACLSSVFSTENLGHIENVIVVDNHSTDGSLEILRAWQSRHQSVLRLVEREQNQLGLARQIIVDQTSTPWLLFTDADCVVPKDWIAKHFTNLEEANLILEPIAGVCGPNRLPDTHLWQTALNIFTSTPFGHGRSPQAMAPEDPLFVSHLPTTNALFKISALKKTKGFRHDLMVGEDAEMGVQLLKQGFKMRMYPSPVVINHSADHFRDWMKRMYGFGEAQWLHSKKRAALIFAAFVLGTAALFALLSLKAIGQIVIFVLLALACATLLLKNTRNIKLVMATLTVSLGTLTFLSYFAGFFCYPFKCLRKVRQ